MTEVQSTAQEVPPPDAGLTSTSVLGASASRPGTRQRTPSAGQRTFAGFHGSSDAKVAALIGALREFWGTTRALPGSFIDLGCGDGRVVVEVARAFPELQTLGVDLQPSLIDKAKANAKHRKADNCQFYVGDLASVDLSGVSVVFLYFPPMALPSLLSVLSTSNLRYGAIVVSADGGWKSRDPSVRSATTGRHANWDCSRDSILNLMQPCNLCWGAADVYFYTWRGNRTMGGNNGQITTHAAEMDAVLEADAKRAASAAAHRIWVKKESERAAAEEKAKEEEAMLAACREKTAALRAAQMQRRSMTAPGSSRPRMHMVSLRQLKRPSVPSQPKSKSDATIARLRAERAQRFERLSLTLSPYMTTLPPIRVVAMR